MSRPSARPAVLLRRHVLEPTWTLLTGATMPSAWQAMEREQYANARVLQDRQLARLRELIQFVHENNDFYRARLDRAGVSPESIRTLDDLRRIPQLTKADVRGRSLELMSRGFDPAALIKAKTGGSTGKPTEVFFTESVSQQRNAIGRRNKRWAGWEVGEPVGAVWGNPVYPSTLRARFLEWSLNPCVYLDTMSVTPESVREFARQWTSVGATMLFGHAHSLYLLAVIAREIGVTSIRPRAILPTSMMLLPHERAVIEAVFGAKATDIYGCEEVGLIAGECEQHHGLHTNVEQLIVEVLREDETPAAPGEAGMVVVTDLLNMAMPFIRYRMEDMAEVSAGSCPCGRHMPTLSRIVGRTADFLVRIDGSRVAGISLIENTLTRIPGIDQMQIVQEALRHVVLRVVRGKDYSSATAQELVGYFEATFPDTRIEMQEVSSIPAEPNGKYRFSICRVNA